MSDEEEDSMSEGFSASEEEWKPGKEVRGGESSDDDDSDFEESPATSVGKTASAGKKREHKVSSGIKGASIKKRKPTGQSLRSKLYNKYRPPPKTLPTSSHNSPTASSSKNNMTSKNAIMPNESDQQEHHEDSSSDSSVENYLVNPAELDLQSSFFTNADYMQEAKLKSPAPVFDCNAGLANLSDSGSEDNNDSSIEEPKTQVFDFHNLLENVNSMERTKETLGKMADKFNEPSSTNNAIKSALDVNALLALGENKDNSNQDEQILVEEPTKLNKTKSTRGKRHTKARPASTVVDAVDTDDSDWEEVAAKTIEEVTGQNASAVCEGNLEIHVDLPSKRTKQQKTADELDLAFRRQFNRHLKEYQLLLHKTSLLFLIGRSYIYNRLVNDSSLMEAALKLLPSKNVYPTERGTDIKYFQSLVTWMKTVIKLNSPNLYPQNCPKKPQAIVKELLEQIKKREARCKQDLVLIFIILARAMGIHCRLVVNMQPLPLRPASSDLVSIKINKQKETKNDNKVDTNLEEQKEQKTKFDKKSKITKAAKTHVEVQVVKSNDSTTQTKIKQKIKNQNIKTEEFASKSSRPIVADNKHVIKSDKNNSTEKISPKLSRLKCGEKKLNTTKKEHIQSTNEKPSTSRSSKHKAQEKTQCHETVGKPALNKLKRAKTLVSNELLDENPLIKKAKLKQQTSLTVEKITPVAQRIRKTSIGVNNSDTKIEDRPINKTGSPVIPKVIVHVGKDKTTSTVSKIKNENILPNTPKAGGTARRKSPKMHISPNFLKTESYKEKFPATKELPPKTRSKNSLDTKLKISTKFLERDTESNETTRVLRTRHQKLNKVTTNLRVPQLDGADEIPEVSKKRPKLEKLQKSRSKEQSDDDFEPSPTKRVKKAPLLSKKMGNLRKDRRVLSTDDEVEDVKNKRKATASDMWVELWSDMEEKWICVDLFKGKLNCIDTILKSTSNNLAYVFAFQNDLSLKDVTARYCSNWSTVVRKSRVEKAWLDLAIEQYLSTRTKRDILEDQELRRIHEEKPMPTTISEYKDHPLYVLERHLLKFQGIYPPNAPAVGFVRGEPVYSRDCVHLLHSRDIWLKQARVVRLGEEPYKIVKARPKWDRITQTVIKDQPLEIFGIWQTQDYEPPTAENGIVPRNAYGNVELFKECMLPKKTVHLRLPGLNRICKKLGIDCANAVIGFDFHQGSCHPMYDGFVVCEEFAKDVTAAWYQDQEAQDRKDEEKREARIYSNWKKLIKGLLIRERLKKKYNF